MKTDMHYGALPAVFYHAKKLRQNPTTAETILWNQLRNHTIGYKFRRQHPTWIYVVDFYCHYLKLVIEIDGGVHENEETKLKDLEKENNLHNLGLTVIRFSNEEVCFDMDNVISRIYSTIESIKSKKYQEKSNLVISPQVPLPGGRGSEEQSTC